MPRAYLFDLDGTLFRGETPIPGAVEALQRLRAAGAAIRYLTNNSTLTRAQFVTKLERMGFQATVPEVISSGWGAALWSARANAQIVFIVGEPGLVQTFRDEGRTVVNATPEGVVGTDGPEAEIVVVGLHRTFTYAILAEAMRRIRAGAKFVATNPDTTYPMEGDHLVPGAGSIVAAVASCSQTEPFVIGKPSPYLIELALSELGIPPSEALVVGDRLDTDIEAGRQAGCPTHLVLTGVETQAPEGQRWSAGVWTL